MKELCQYCGVAFIYGSVREINLKQNFLIFEEKNEQTNVLESKKLDFTYLSKNIGDRDQDKISVYLQSDSFCTEKREFPEIEQKWKDLRLVRISTETCGAFWEIHSDEFKFKKKKENGLWEEIETDNLENEKIDRTEKQGNTAGREREANKEEDFRVELLPLPSFDCPDEYIVGGDLIASCCSE